MSNRFCSLSLSLLFALFPAINASADSLANVANAFLRELEIPEAVQSALIEKVKSGGDRVSCVVESDSTIYSYSSGKAPKDRDADVQSELERVEATFHTLRARHALVINMTMGRLDRKQYHDDDALGDAMYSHYKRSGIVGLQSASDVVDGWAMALVWFKPEVAKAVREMMPETEELNDDYCSFLYERAKNLFDTGHYSEALPVFKHIHDFRWANISAYMDAAECFLRTGESEDCRKLLRELVDTLGEKMSSDELARGGRLFREAGDREGALLAFKMARERLRKEK